MTQPSWVLDPLDPRAPSEDVWSRMTEAERARVLATLPSDMPLDLHPPEGDPHRKPKEKARDALDAFFRRIGRRVYVSSELVTYYPGERRFCPDILAVLDVESHDRTSWIVSREGKGLDLVIEIHVGGDAAKDLSRNVEFYAKLGIPEYFVFDRPTARVLGYRLRTRDSNYERIVPQAGRLASEALGLELTVETGMLRFYHGTAPLLFMDELVGKLDAMVADLVEARDAAAKRADEEAKLRGAEGARADALQREVDVLKAQLEKLRER